ncbi:MAG: thioredoxin family protein [Acidobacteria bacterium]|nr:thioredoxin family protein [Acidobacteriota bacterium]
MKKQIKILALTLVIALGLSSSVYALDALKKGVEPGKWTQDLVAATEYAKNNDLPIMVMFTGSDWCYWCKLMDKSVFSGNEFFDWAKDNIVLVAIDFPRDKSKVPTEFQARNKQLGREFKVRGVPTYVFLKPDGKTEIGRLSAGKGKTPKSFIQEINQFLKK